MGDSIEICSGGPGRDGRLLPDRRSGRIGAVESELLELLDREAIGETIFRLFIATDRRDWEAVGNRDLESGRED
jgi:hypothetical protein